ncbi:flagellar export protein FliJ [Hathewaya massiliensis]|uniref:flagellar export protein FliJ n=1 Tax=Hathewaya massiliensis TaxID=1964382 RepID=UPI001158C8C8|nr:flagellar export protein FliJ [Hathewaya massiliensis]
MSNKFNFKLQKLLDIREKEEELSKVAFKKASEEKKQVENKIINLKENYKKYNIFNSDESIIDRKLKVSYLKCLDSSINSANIELHEKDEMLYEKRKDLMEKQVKRKTVETLKENYYAEFLKETNMVEQRLNDEFALYGFIRASRELRK